MLTIYKKDIHQYFTTLTGYLFIAAILVVGGIYCYIYNLYYRYSSFETAIGNLPFFFTFLIPLVSCGVFTEERKQKTEQLLYTSPLKSREIVFGKYLALLTVIAIPLVVMSFYPLILAGFGKVYFQTTYAYIFAVFLLAAALAAICMFISTLSENMLVAAIVSFGLLYLLSQMGALSEALTGSGKNSFIGFVIIAVILMLFVLFMTKNIYIAAIPAFALIIIFRVLYMKNMTLLAGKINLVLNGFAIFSRLEGFKAGVFDITAVVYYVVIAALFVLLSIYSFERRRWA